MAKPEQWRIVPSVPGILVSTKGRFLIVPTVGEMPHGGVRHYSGIARRGHWKGTALIFRWDGRTFRVHRLVCEAFHGPAPFEDAVCMHLDENAKNNSPDNLKWGTQKENLNAPGFLNYCRSRVGENNPFIKGRARKAA